MTLSEALAASEEATGPVNDVLNIDAESREIDLPASESLFGVEGEKDVERKYFRCPKIVGDNIDLSTHQIYVHYTTATTKTGGFDTNKMVGAYRCDDVKDDESGNYITFSWLLSDNVLSQPGFVGFAVFAKYNEGEELKTKWKTQPAIGTVAMTVPDGEVIAEKYPDVINQIFTKLAEMEKGNVSDEAVAAAVSDYMAANPVNVVVDSELNEESANPIQNKVVAKKFSELSKEIGDLSQLSAYGTNVAEILLKLINGGTLTPDEEETLSSTIPVVRITGDLTGISADDYVNVTCDYTDETNNLTFTDYAEFAYQGSGSLAFTNVVDGIDVAKNFKIKLYSDEARTEKNKRVFKDWHATNNFHLKCNYADATNIMNNLMMNYLTKSYQYLTPLPREGARYTVDGFPVLLYVNDVFTGIRFWNLKQDDKVYNLNEEIKDESTGEVTQEADLCYQIGRNNGTNTGDNSGAFIYGNLSSYGNTFADAHEEIDWYWEDRVWDKVSNHPSVLYDTIQWVSEASDDEFKANLTQYFDKEYLIHYFVMMYACGMIDSKGKNFNMLYFPEKGVWYPTFWDMDNAFGTSYGVSKSFVTTSLNGYGCPSSRLFDKLYANFEDEIIEHYQKLRPKLFTLTELEDSIDKTLLNVSSSWLAKNFEVKYDGTSYSPITDPKTYILDWASKRFEYMDTVLVKESSDDIPTTSISLDKNTLTFVATNAQSLVATVLPTDSTQTVSWESSNDSIATVLNGVVTPIGNGECTITATSGDYSAICHVKVNVESLNVMYEKGYINNTGSLTQANYNIVGTEYIEVESDKFYRINLSDEYDFSSDVTTLRIAEYDSEKNFIKRYYSETATIALDKSMIKVSADCKYVRLGFNLKNYYDADAHEKYTSLFERTQFVEIENAMSDLNITFSQGSSHGTGTEANRVTMNIGECKFARTMNISVGEGYSLFIYAVNGEQISSPTIGAWHDSNITLSNNSGLPTTDGYIKPYSSLVSSEIVIKPNDNKGIAPNEIENLVVITWT